MLKREYKRREPTKEERIFLKSGDDLYQGQLANIVRK